MNTWINKLLLVALFTFSTILVSCGGGSGGGGDSVVDAAGDVATGEKGTVTLMVTDAPTDDFKEINMTVLKVELLCDGGKEELFSGEKEFDLLQLVEWTEVLSVSEVSAGYCNKFRLYLSQIELVFKDSSKPNAYPKLPGKGKVDLLSKKDFYVGPDNPLYIQLDFDAKKSIHIKGKADYNFRPVVFIKVVEGRFDTKLIRQRGTIENLDDETEEFDLCLIEAEIQPVSKHNDDDSSDDDSSDDDSRDCVRVDTTAATDTDSLFDNKADPISFKELENGDIATVVGRFSFYHSKSDKSSDDKSSDDKSSDDDSSDDSDRPGMVLDAEVIWTEIIGEDNIEQTANIACSTVTTDTEFGTWYKNYVLPVPDDGEVCKTPGAVRTILRPGSKIYNSEGKQLDDSYIAPGIPNKVDAAVDIAGKTGDLKAVLVMLGLDDPLNLLDQLTGTISSVDLKSEPSTMTLMTSLGDRCVIFDSFEVEVYETGLDDEGDIFFNQMTVLSLESGQRADVFGIETSSGCVDAETIIYQEQGASIDPV